jgi:hypothetical protein
VPFAGDQHPVQALAAGAGNPAFRDRVRPRRLDRCLDDPDPGRREHGGERRRELGVPVPDEELEAAGVVAEVHQKVASLLGHPLLRGMSRQLGAGVVEDLRGEDVERHAQAAAAQPVQAVEVDPLHPRPGPVASVQHDRLDALTVAVAGEAQGSPDGARLRSERHQRWDGLNSKPADPLNVRGQRTVILPGRLQQKIFLMRAVRYLTRSMNIFIV